MDEYIQIMRHLWSDDETTFNGKFVRLHRARCLSEPIQVAGIPIVIGGHTEVAAARPGGSATGSIPPPRENGWLIFCEP
jgi:alkanesulfonate monooxygenase SsuD/methylene tetrahydromethanopterin reductase-like flavin-dependent oxidoreductase (luciferase family)